MASTPGPYEGRTVARGVGALVLERVLVGLLAAVSGHLAVRLAALVRAGRGPTGL